MVSVRVYISLYVLYLGPEDVLFTTKTTVQHFSVLIYDIYIVYIYIYVYIYNGFGGRGGLCFFFHDVTLKKLPREETLIQVKDKHYLIGNSGCTQYIPYVQSAERAMYLMYYVLLEVQIFFPFYSAKMKPSTVLLLLIHTFSVLSLQLKKLR